MQMFPVAGNLRYLSPPTDSVKFETTAAVARGGGDGLLIRVDSGVMSGDDISVFYDPMIAKLIVWGRTRAEALTGMCNALARFHIAGLPNNVAFLRRLTTHPKVHAGQVGRLFCGSLVTVTCLCIEHPVLVSGAQRSLHQPDCLYSIEREGYVRAARENQLPEWSMQIIHSCLLLDADYIFFVLYVVNNLYRVGEGCRWEDSMQEGNQIAG